MKTILKWVVGCLLIMSMSGVPVLAADGVTVELDGNRVSFSDQQPVIVDGRTLVPVRGIFEQLGYNISWDDPTQTAILSNGINTVIIKRWQSTFTTNGKSYNLDVTAQTINGRMMIPFRAVLESVACGVDWDGGNNTVIVSTSKNASSNNVTVNNTSTSNTAVNNMSTSNITASGYVLKTETLEQHNSHPNGNMAYCLDGNRAEYDLALPSELAKYSWSSYINENNFKAILKDFIKNENLDYGDFRSIYGLRYVNDALLKENERKLIGTWEHVKISDDGVERITQTWTYTFGDDGKLIATKEYDASCPKFNQYWNSYTIVQGAYEFYTDSKISPYGGKSESYENGKLVETKPYATAFLDPVGMGLEFIDDNTVKFYNSLSPDISFVLKRQSTNNSNNNSLSSQTPSNIEKDNQTPQDDYITPTKSLLNGDWMVTTSGAASLYSFSEDGTIYTINSVDGQESVLYGTYTLDGNKVNVKYTLASGYLGTVDFSSEPQYDSFYIKLSTDGRTLYFSRDDTSYIPLTRASD